MKAPTKNPQALSQEEKMLALSHFIFAPLSEFERMSEGELEASADALLVAVELAGQPYALNLRRYDALHASLKDQITALAQELAGYPSAPDLHALQAAFAQHQEAYQQDLHALHQANAWLQTKIEENHSQLETKIEENHSQLEAKMEENHSQLEAKMEENHSQLEAKINALACDDQPNSALASQLETLSQRVTDHYADLDEKIRIARQIEESSTSEVYALLTNLAQLGVENQARISALEAHLAKP